MSNKAFFVAFCVNLTTQVIQVINVTLSDYLILCYWECFQIIFSFVIGNVSKWALLEPFIVKGVRNCFITLNKNGILRSDCD